MLVSQEYGPQLLKILERLPVEKAQEVVDFAEFLKQQYGQPPHPHSQIDEADLLNQQKALAKIWDDPEEDLYEL